MLLHSRDGHQPAVRVAEMPTGFVRLNLTGALHQDARDDLETVRNPVLHLLQKDRLLAQQVVLKLLVGPSLGYIRNSQEDADMLLVVVVEFVRIYDKQTWVLPVANEFKFIRMHLGRAGSRPFK